MRKQMIEDGRGMIDRKYQKIEKIIFYPLFSILYFLSSICYADDSSEYVKQAWAAKGARDFSQVYKITDECSAKFSKEADKLASGLSEVPSKNEVNNFKVMNDAATCLFIKAETFREENNKEDAKKTFQIIVDKYPYSQAYDPRGWYWSLKEKALIAIWQFEGKAYEPQDIIEEEKKVKLFDAGGDIPIDYSQYGEFKGAGTKDYAYIIKDQSGLAGSVGEGVYPNTSGVKSDPEFIKIKKELMKIGHWEILNSRNFNSAFYKWTAAPEPEGVRQFYIADILERSGLIKQAIKAYYAILVHFPKTYGWTYWQTPWYVGKVALYRIKYLLRENPDLGIILENADIQIENGYDNDIRNDIFIVHPGRLVKVSKHQRRINDKCQAEKRRLGKIVQTKGGEKVKFVKYETGDWQLLVEGKPFIIKGITYGPTKVGESPDTGSLQNWSTQDTNNNGLIDSPMESWVDKNKNDIRDKDEKTAGDFYLMKEMGVNTLRLYHQPHSLNKNLLRQMYEKYGIYIILGDFLGKYTLGSKAEWASGTDYDNEEHKKNMLESVRSMVMEFKDEPYVLIWLLGNENVYGLGCNADKKPESFFKFANEAALLIKSLDEQRRPVAIASGDVIFLDIFAKNSPDIDIFGTNAYRGKYGFMDLWDAVKKTADKPAFITEYGAPSYAKGYSLEEAENYQADYHRGSWVDISCNSCGYNTGNSMGGFVFEWTDEWWKAYEPAYHDKHALFAGPFLGGYIYEEWLGVTSQGNGQHSPFLRQLRKSYYIYKKMWSK